MWSHLRPGRQRRLAPPRVAGIVAAVLVIGFAVVMGLLSWIGFTIGAVVGALLLLIPVRGRGGHADDTPVNIRSPHGPL